MKEYLIIVDVQECFLKKSKHILDFLNTKEGNQYLKKFDKVINIYDTIDENFNYSIKDNGLFLGEDYEYIYKDYDENYEGIENEYFLGKLFSNYPQKYKSISKEYGFLRDYMDSGIDRDDIIEIGKKYLELQKNNKDYDFIEKTIKKEYGIGSKKDLNTKNLSFYIPDFLSNFLIKEIENKENIKITLIGGAINECLTEIELLLNIIGIDYDNIKIDNLLIY